MEVSEHIIRLNQLIKAMTDELQVMLKEEHISNIAREEIKLIELRNDILSNSYK